MGLPRLVLLTFAAVTVVIAVWHTAEAWHVLGATRSPLVAGEVIRREPWRRFGRVPAGRLSIRILGSDTVVVAETDRTALEGLPHRVRFHYTGDPGREVFVEGEEQPLWVALFLWAVSGGLILVLCGGPLLRRRRSGSGRTAA